APFPDYEEKGVFVWCRSSNEGAGELQDLTVSSDGAGRRLFELVAERASAWNRHGNVGLVVGATYPEELKAVRSNCPGMPILVPGVGAQTGELDSSVRFALDSDRPNMLISSSRSILYASSDRSDFAGAARSATEDLRTSINRVVAAAGRAW
ncbi:MAG: orotidine 5'-phosphate decarboxylase, partial [Chloroflexi bacterium]|nr:orotidine 5'-phosphate decarboxylase [Chloroflexota bacterium]